MDLLTIEGGVRLEGTLPISGSKNAALPILIASLLTDEVCRISNVPNLRDIDTVVSLLSFLGKTIVREENTIKISSGSALSAEAPYDLVRKMRASVVVMGPLIARLGRVKVSLPGGCAIGGRPINIHLDGFRSLGAEIRLEEGYVSMQASRLIGSTIVLSFASVGATENLMMAASLAQGRTVIKNSAKEPEITDLADCLRAMGARIDGDGTDVITIEGVDRLKGIQHWVIPDRIETGTYMIAAAITRGHLRLENTQPDHLGVLIEAMKQAGVAIETKGAVMDILWSGPLKPISMETEIFPGFPTDLQAQWMALMSQAHGESEIKETVFENRFMHVPELQRMGADIVIKGNTSVIRGKTVLSGADVMVSDLRAGAALVLAGLAATGKTTIHRIYHLDRGYEALEQKLSSVGAKISRSQE